MRARALVIAAIVALTTSSPLVARADESKARAEARRYAEEGRALLERGKPIEALDSLRKAEAAFHAPTIVLLMAQAQRDLGRLRAAVALYRRVLAEPVAADAPPAFRSAYEIALLELREAQSKVGFVDLVVRPPGVAATITLAGDEMAGAGPYEVDPGVSTPIRVTAQGYEPAEEVVQVQKGARQRVEIELRPSGSTFERAGRSPAPVFVGAGLLALGLAVGIPTGLSARAREKELALLCPNHICLPGARDARSLHASATLLADVSTSAFITAGVGAALATVFLVASRGGSRWSTSSLRLGPVASPSFTGLTGSF